MEEGEEMTDKYERKVHTAENFFSASHQPRDLPHTQVHSGQNNFISTILSLSHTVPTLGFIAPILSHSLFLFYTASKLLTHKLLAHSAHSLVRLLLGSLSIRLLPFFTSSLRSHKNNISYPQS